MNSEFYEKWLGKDYQFLLAFFPGEKIISRFRYVGGQLHELIFSMGLEDSLAINYPLLKIAIIDYFTDLSRLKPFHGIERANVKKIYSYGTYWLLRRKPIQILNANNVPLHINEEIALAMLIPKLVEETNVNTKDKDGNVKQAFLDYCELFRYNLKYRVYTPQSLELAIESFFVAAELANIKS
ncbi:MAG: hypothetical protein LBM98_08240 [Oscillospiraceae bacterium]|jgi:hypothetical protein|nr:hypothetical protein [Oscillospiraceae bacterium]